MNNRNKLNKSLVLNIITFGCELKIHLFFSSHNFPNAHRKMFPIKISSSMSDFLLIYPLLILVY